MIKGEKIELEISRVDDQGKGSGFSSDGKLVIVENVDEDDESITVEITKVMEETYFGKKVSKSSSKKNKINLNGPYDMDDGEDDEDEDYEKE